MLKFFKILLILFTLWILLGSWGFTGHKYITTKSGESLKQVHPAFENWMQLVAFHTADADLRKPFDSTEFDKHFIDIDNYPEYLNSGAIHQDYDSLVQMHGVEFVHKQGVLPWSTNKAIQNLIKAFRKGDFEQATIEAANISHYVADGFMPFHITRNYDGQFSGNDGIHYRYESLMINEYADEIEYEVDSIVLIDDYQTYIFSYLYKNYLYIDTLLWADKKARSINAVENSLEYTADLWNSTEKLTTKLFKNASQAITNIIYSCWGDAGKPEFDLKYIDHQLSNSHFEISMIYFNGRNRSLNWIFKNNEEAVVRFAVRNSEDKEVFTETKKYTKGTFEETNSIQLEKGEYCFVMEANGKVVKKKFKVY